MSRPTPAEITRGLWRDGGPVLAVLMVLLVAAPVTASERYALIVSGANGDASYADQYGQWRQSTVTALLP